MSSGPAIEDLLHYRDIVAVPTGDPHVVRVIAPIDTASVDAATVAAVAAAQTAAQDAVADLTAGTHTIVPDVDYQCVASDQQVGVKPLTAPRTIYLPDVDTYPLGRVLFIADESGACSDAIPITIQVGPGTGDNLAGQSSIQITNPYQGLGFRRGAANLWIRA